MSNAKEEPGDRIAATMPRPARIACCLGGIILPVLFAMGVNLLLDFQFDPPWQDGTLAQRAALLWSFPAFRMFLPFWGYAMISLALVVIAPARCREWFVVRWGIYTGMILVAAGMLMGAAATVSQRRAPYAALLAALAGQFVELVVGFGIVWLVVLAARRWGSSRVMAVVVGVVAVVIAIGIIACLVFKVDDRMIPFAIEIILGAAVMCCGLPGTASTYILLAWWVWRTSKRSAPLWSRLALPAAWAGSYAISCHLAVLAALEAYAQLPKTLPPQDCYIATAAARGHAKFVGVERVTAIGSGQMAINAQLRYLKCGEIALRAIFPAVHRACRWIYDRVGPWLARKLRYPIYADFAYLSLKPLEWIVRIFLIALAGSRAKSLARAIYGLER